MNRLQYESSPYLLQHASNPVDWYPWGEEAFEKARKEHKPVLVSIGYSTCHWCHVMERESFEDEATARMMNEFFVNIKVDREERPDVDQVYMDAVQYLGVSGGWPLNVFLTPDKKPFYGGTYFPPRPAYNRPSWEQILLHIHRIFEDRRGEVEEQADRLIEAIGKGHHQFLADRIGPAMGPKDLVQTMSGVFSKVRQLFDEQYGGIGGAPKFPSTMMLRNIATFGMQNRTGSYFSHFLFTLERMATGGIYDQIGGGFARYSVDAKWHVPHFEKMLYDNALLLSCYSLAYTLSKDPFYRNVVEETVAFLNREMQSPGGLYYAAYDADSEGVEGKFYVWQKKELESFLGATGPLVSKYYQVTEAGNWEGTNILFPQKRPGEFATGEGLDPAVFKQQLDDARAILYARRQKRIPPGLDNKCIVSWNALLIKGLVDGYAATGDMAVRRAAVGLYDNVSDMSLDPETGRLYHLADGKMGQEGFLDDYAFLIRAAIALHQVTGEFELLMQARRLTEFVLSHFLASSDKLFYFTEEDSDAVVRKIELYDNALPSGNAVMAENLWHLGKIFDLPDWSELSVSMVTRMEESIRKYPRAFPYWLDVWIQQKKLNAEVVIIGEDAIDYSLALLGQGVHSFTWVVSAHEVEGVPLLAGRHRDDKTLIYICQDFQCQQPVETAKEALHVLEGFYDFSI